ncbi:hypothetical protein A3C37_01380 [Candidatus Peribacteria bacterium RIFCSPHIGHO2_02_FULL_53_20]|nr:MAG: hypothetical protein A3C37_01380 [Candidatus Peribacteria bacterium RIFCSPHIGHO2_02_FULL_53_20]OGJ67619.1 MAG: hypothetical protein A3B61_02050 [Candidatus Peribacteria bacterium RIFCSPLOWO2_01_FULL_53_10]OGJ74993.1 MAG: hypothetical protein A3G69_00695 [Candidatus Peribacteria bacterium RIFCSPLOWO2_12_FULL_53_10]
MLTQVSFTTEETLKNRALEKAKSQGITLKALLVYAMRGFVDGKIALSIDVSEEEPEVEELIFADKDINAKAKKLARLLR